MITAFLDVEKLPNREMQEQPFNEANAYYFSELPNFGQQINSSLALINMLSAGSGFALAYNYSNVTTDADPGANTLRMSSTTQNLSTVLRLDVTSGGKDVTAILDAMTSSTSANKGQIRLVKSGDISKYMVFNLTGKTTPTGWRNLTVTHVASSSSSPFVNGDLLIMSFSRTGDIGPAGSMVRRVASTTTAAAPAPNADATDIYILTAQASPAGFIAPTGTPYDGQPLLIRIKDNGTARLLTFSTAYRASADLAFPATTLAGKWLYIGFNYNAIDAKWDLVAVINNFG